MTNAATIKEVLEAYNAARTKWEAALGEAFSEEAFHAWFTSQVIK